MSQWIFAGFNGKKCEKLTSIGFRESDSYSRLVLPTNRAVLNITIVLATRQREGVIMYHGSYTQHAAVEVFRGRVRVSYDIGNYPVSTMFSYVQIGDGEFHRLMMLLEGKNFTMQIDDGQVSFFGCGMYYKDWVRGGVNG